MADFNIFGSAPEYLTGLLGQQGVEDLQKKALTTGLINTALGYLAQPKNQRLGGPLPYLARAAQAGMTSAQGVYDQGLKNFEVQQKIDEINRKKVEQKAREGALETLKTSDPELYNIAMGFPSAADQIVAAKYKPQDVYAPVLTDEQAKAYGLDPAAGKYSYTKEGPKLIAGAKPDKGFGSGVQGTALNYLVQGSGNTPEAVAFRSTPEYALSYRQATMPTPVQVEETDSLGNVRQVTKLVTPSALPKNILPPVIGQQQVQPVATQPAPSVTQRIPGSTSPIVAEDYTSGTGVYGATSGVKSSPYTPSQSEIKDYRDKKNQSLRLKSTLSDLQNFVTQNPNPNLWGVGKTSSKLQSKYEDALTQMRLSAELGVLNKEDLPRLQAALPNPAELQTWIKGGGTLDSFMGAVEAQNERLDRDIQFYDTYLNPGAKQKAPEATVTPVSTTPLPLKGGVIDALKLRNGVTYELPGGKSGKWNSKKKIFE